MLFDLMIENLNLTDVNPLICGHHECEPGHRYGPATRDYYLIHFVHQGCGTLINERGRQRVEEEQIFVIRPGEITTYEADLKDPWFYTWIGFEASEQIANNLSADVYSAIGCDSLFRQMINSKRQNSREYFLCSKIYELLTMLQSKDIAIEESASRYIRIAKNYIESNFNKEVKIAQVAENLKLDRSYFSHLFTEHMKLSPQQYLINVRMQKAQTLLEQSDYTISEIAAQVGYNDCAAFSRIFKRYIDMTPSDYRKKIAS